MRTRAPCATRHCWTAEATPGPAQIGFTAPGNRSNGLGRPPVPRPSTCVQICVLATSQWPGSAGTVRIPWPASSRCMANGCRNAQWVAGLAMRARAGATLDGPPRVFSATCWRPARPLRRSTDTRRKGNRYGQPGPPSAPGYLRADACGGWTRPLPPAGSWPCSTSARPRCRSRRPRRDSGRGTHRSRPPLSLCPLIHLRGSRVPRGQLRGSRTRAVKIRPSQRRFAA